MSYSTVIQLMLFQSTLSVRRATVAILTVSLIYLIFQSTLSVRRATIPDVRSAFHIIFQSTLSVRRATLKLLFTDT